MFNVNDIYARLANGEKIEDIGNEIAAMMNEAVAMRAAEEVKAEQEQTKRDLIEELIDIVHELAILEGMDPTDLEVTDEDIDQLVQAFTEMFAAMRDLKALFAAAPAAKSSSVKIVTDDQILADFIKAFNWSGEKDTGQFCS